MWVTELWLSEEPLGGVGTAAGSNQPPEVP